MIKKIFNIMLFVFISTQCMSCTTLQSLSSKDLNTMRRESDLILKATALKVKALKAGTTVDAVEGDPSQLSFSTVLVLFRVDDVLKGEYIKLKVGGPSKLEQAQEAMNKKNAWKVLTMDFQDPEEEYTKEWISVAVKNPYDSFGIEQWESPPKNQYNLYFKTAETPPDSFILIGSAIEIS